MSAKFTSASSQYLLSNVAAYPLESVPNIGANVISVGLWVKPTTLGVLERFWFMGAATATLGIFVGKTAANTWNCGHVDAAGSLAMSAEAGTPVVGSWAYILARFSTGPSLTWNGTIGIIDTSTSSMTVAQAQNSGGTFSSIAATQVRTSIGARGFTVPANFFTGNVAELSVFSGDPLFNFIQATFPHMMQELAFHGPISQPSFRTKLLEYRSLRNCLTVGDPDDYMNAGRMLGNAGFGGGGSAASPDWTNQNGAVLSGDNPPLWPNYMRPKDFTRIGIV